MRKLLLIGTLAMLSACADITPVETYEAYLEKTPCSAEVTTDCRSADVVKTMSDPVKEFAAASKAFQENKGSMTLEISKDFIEKKNTFEDLVETLVEGE